MSRWARNGGRFWALVVGQGAWLAMVGAAAGLAGAFALTRFMRSLLFEVSAMDPAIFIGVPLLLVRWP